MAIKILAVIVVLGILFLVKSRHDKKKYKQRIKMLLNEEWGMYTRDEYSDKIWKNIRFYHDRQHPVFSLDDITWNDLEMDEVFQLLNHTRTSPGEEMLYHILRTPLLEQGELEARERILQSMKNHPDKTRDFEMALYDIGKTDYISVYEYLRKVKDLKGFSRWPHIFMALVLLGGIISLFWSTSDMLMLILIVMGVNAYFYYKAKGRIIQDVALFEFILGIIRQCDAIRASSLPGCEEYFERLGSLAEKFQKYGRFHWLVSGGNTMSGSLFDSLFDYVRILFHVDLIKIGTMIQEVQKYEKDLLEIYEIIGYLDSMLAVASYRDMVQECTIPKLQQTRKIMVQDLYHPLVKKPVKNSIASERSVLLTGSNASGKSTFIKAVAVNAIFAQTIHTVLASSYEGGFFRIYSSMALRDSIETRESYFIVEIKSLQRIFEALSHDDTPILCFIDEILRGTNTLERVAASSGLLEELSRQNVLCFAATHDMELTYLLEDCFANYHFEEKMIEGDISFDYQLKIGRANTRNALRLLEMIGFDRQIIEHARKRAQTYLEQGIWKSE